ncbi:putative fatty acid synthase [Tieghemostelium lacteum]|uniref:Putative fatty acid synthase n=1 Tax=Tieghemostelium lacteum TaxID=361077 RepID=A0A152A5Q6_TIELA|nr:putative fatty acid synthase [Tieghemostelium lacteum]|eukprot:KYR01562.1 putative fatty acid synthase [Tieghemostelium lacteum]
MISNNDETNNIPVQANSDDIAIIGIGCRFPGGSNTPDEFWKNLYNQVESVKEVPSDRWSKTYHEQGFIANGFGGMLPLEDWTKFDSIFFGISAKEALTLDPQQRVLLTCIWEALEDAHIKPHSIRGSNSSVFVGVMNKDYDNICYAGSSSAGSYISNRLSFAYDLRGPSMTVDTACSSSLNAIHLGCQTILKGQSDMSICGGVNALLDPLTSKKFTEYGFLGKKGHLTTFDAAADGYTRGEGVGMVILKRLSKAVQDQDRIYCVIKGSSSNVDGYNHKTNITQPSKESQSENIEMALKNANVMASDIYYVEAHGTGTPVGDPIEVESLSKVFKNNHTSQSPLYIGSVKPNIGHLESASGIASIVKVAMMLKNRQLIPTINLKTPNPKINFDEWNLRVVQKPIDFPTDKLICAGVNSFGVSGSNCHVVLQEYRKPSSPYFNSNVEGKEYLIPFSANSKVSLDKFYQSIINIPTDTQSLNSFIDFVQYQCTSKSNLCQRMVISASSWKDIKDPLVQSRTVSNVTSTISTPKSEKPPVVFVFCGQGPQWKGMGDYLYQTNKVFKEAVEKCDSMLKQYFKYSIYETLKNSTEEESHQPKLAQPSIFLLQVGLYEFYSSFNIKPDIVVGHSFGEVTSALYAGIINLDTAVKIVYQRATAQQRTIGTGRMMSIGISETKYQEISKECGLPAVEIACYNSHDSIVITGNEYDLNLIKDAIKDKGVTGIFLGTPCSFHSSKQEMIRDDVHSTLGDLPVSMKPKIPFFSTVSGQQVNESGFYNSEYIYQNLRSAVKFDEAIENIIKMINNQQYENNSTCSPIFIEITPHPTLTFYLQAITKSLKSKYTNIKDPVFISPLHKKKDEAKEIKEALSNLYCKHSLDVDFFNGQSLSSGDYSYKYRTDFIPKYQWDMSQEFWDEPLEKKRLRLEGPSSDFLGSNKHQGSLVFENQFDLKRPAFHYLKGHQLKGKYLFPGSGYIDILMKHYYNERHTHDYELVIYNLEFQKPFFLTEGIVMTLQTSIQAITLTEFKVEFNFKQHQKDQKWTKSCIGKFGLVKLDYNSTQRDLKQMADTCSFAELTKADLYKKMCTLGLPYGPTFQRTHTMSVGPDACYCSLEIPPPPSYHTQSDYFFDASVLDAALHGLLALSPPPQEIVFDKVEKLKFYPKNLPEDRPSFLKVYSIPIEHRGNTSTGLVEIINPDTGRLIISLEASCTSLIKLKQKYDDWSPGLKYPTKELMSLDWQLKESALSNISDKDSISNPIDIIRKLLDITSKLSDAPQYKRHLLKILYFNQSNDNADSYLKEVSECLSTINNNSTIKFDVEFTLFDLYGTSQEFNETIFTLYNTENLSIKTRTSTQDSKFNGQQEKLSVSYYDLIILPKILGNLASDNLEIYPFINECYKLLLPKGSIVSIEPVKEAVTQMIQSCLPTCITQVFQCPSVNQSIVLSQKEGIFKTKQTGSKIHVISSNLISENDSLKEFKSNHVVSKNCKEFIEEHGSSLSNNDIVLFAPALASVPVDVYKQLTLEYINVSRFLLGKKLQCKVILMSMEGQNVHQCHNYLVGSLIGIHRYLLYYRDEQYAIDVDSESLQSLTHEDFISLSDYQIHGEREFTIRKGQVYTEKVFKNPNTLQSTCYESELDNLYMSLNPSTLKFQFKPKVTKLTGDQVEVKVMSSCIGNIPSSKKQMFTPTSGKLYEFAGIVTRLASNVTKLKIGDQVLGFASQYTPIATSHVLSTQQYIVLKPSNLSFSDSILPMSFLTVYQALFNVGRLDLTLPESVLIHCANEPLGLAALNILEWKTKDLEEQPKVFVTVDSQESEKYIKERYGSLITNCFSSQTSQYSFDIKSQYKGVDLILNSLSVDFQTSNVNCLSKVGRIMDLVGVNSITGDLKFQMGYQSIDIESIISHNPRGSNQVLTTLTNALASGELKPFPTIAFTCLQIQEAIEQKQEGKQLGKIFIDYKDFNDDILQKSVGNLDTLKIPKIKHQVDHIRKTMIVTGQAGIASQILRWVAGETAISDIIVLSRSSLKWELQLLSNQIKYKKLPVNIHFRQCDVSKLDDIKTQIKSVQEETKGTLPEIKSVLHFAAVYDVTNHPDDITLETINNSHDPKALGAINLHQLSLDWNWNLDSFVMFSSMASGLCASDKESMYCSANLVLDHLSHYRKSRGLASSSIMYGAMDAGGAVANNKAIEEFLRSKGVLKVSLSKILGGLDLAMQNSDKTSNFFVASLIMPMLLFYPPVQRKIEHLLPNDHYKSTRVSKSESSTYGSSNSTQDRIVNTISDLLSMNPSNLNLDSRLQDYGMDSLLSVQLKNFFDQEYSQNLFTQFQITSVPIHSLISKTIKFVQTK